MHYRFDDYSLDTNLRELRRGPNLVTVEPQVFDLLEYLLRHRERVVSKDDLLAGVWRGRIVSESALTTRINAARAAIGDSGETQHFIKTLRGKGLRFVGNVQKQAEPPETTSDEIRTEPATARSALSDQPSIAVLPFLNMSGDPEQSYFADGMTEEIITALTRFKSSFLSSHAIRASTTGTVRSASSRSRKTSACATS